MKPRFSLVKPVDEADRLGDQLTAQGHVTPDQLRIALHEQERKGGLLGEVLVGLGFLADDDLAKLLATRTGNAAVDMAALPLDMELVGLFSLELLRACRAVPLDRRGARVRVAVADPYDVHAMDRLRCAAPAGVELDIVVAGDAALAKVLDHLESDENPLDHALAAMEQGEWRSPRHETWTHPVVRLVDVVLADAARQGASDIHFEPEEACVRLRYRVDGAMVPVRLLHRAHWPEVSHRLKIMAGLNIADTRSMQDGRFGQTLGGVAMDFRVAVMPTVQGENIVVRLLDPRRALMSLDQLGFAMSEAAQLEHLLQRPEGIILVTGPTGSGKTTTLYAMLTKLRADDVNIMTLEEPVEYRFEGLRQTAVNEAHGLGFAEGVRGILRQDPDIIFIGEVRDPATATMAMRASMTGHQVFSTLHCNDALGALPRLIDLGQTPRMLSGNVAGIVAQRLVRTLCPHCKRLRAARADEEAVLALAEMPEHAHGFAEAQSPFLAGDYVVYEANGCAACRGTGRRGRIVIAEVLRVTPELDEMIAADAPRSALLRQAQREGFRSMVEDGLAKVCAGLVAMEDLRGIVDMTRQG